ncbi:MAG TPA: Rieske (2Fe-2S) protein [Candidatus Kapabacteria bacterium]|nr:Rieske (2Fe-2S) protein [Candidatus Kapabacteria bacterium]
MDRRKFLESVCVTVAGTAIVGPLLNLRSAGANARPLGHANDVREIPIDLTDAPDLKPVGGTYNLEFDDLNRNILVVHVKPNMFTAVDIKCTHSNCEVNYDVDHTRFYCPCHGSEFDLYGHVLKGPATKPLNYYHAELKGDEVMVTIYGADDPVPANSIPPPLDTTTVRSAKPDSTANSGAHW